MNAVLKTVEENWPARFEALNKTAALPGNPNVPLDDPNRPWLDNQRMAAKAGILSSAKVMALTELGVDLKTSRVVPWEYMFEGLKIIAATRKHDPNVPRSHPTHGKWLDGLRTSYKAGRLSADKIKALEDLGVQWHLGRGWGVRL